MRNIAGVLMAIGCGKAPPGWVEEVLHHRNRTLGGVTAPPFGLYFMAVTYPDAFAIPAPEADIPFRSARHVQNIGGLSQVRHLDAGWRR